MAGGYINPNILAGPAAEALTRSTPNKSGPKPANLGDDGPVSSWRLAIGGCARTFRLAQQPAAASSQLASQPYHAPQLDASSTHRPAVRHSRRCTGASEISRAWSKAGTFDEPSSYLLPADLLERPAHARSSRHCVHPSVGSPLVGITVHAVRSRR
jgi:hypothetical protein